jgi:hypothetical protein
MTITDEDPLSQSVRPFQSKYGLAVREGEGDDEDDDP